MKSIYINDDINKGIAYDWKQLRKDFEALHVPEHVYTPLNCPFEKAHLFVNMSDRSVGKTTNWLLLGLCMWKRYGTILHYIRSRVDMITPKALQDLFSTIVEYGYIEKLTDGEYNNVFYRARRWYFTKVENEEQVKISETHFMFCASIDENFNLKSSYNAPKGDFILFDEFIGKYYPPNEFVYFCDTIKTIIRDRISPIVIFSANTIDRNSPYFNELEIFDDIQAMTQGETRLVTSSGGTPVFVEIVGQNVERQKRRSLVNKLFFGFKNPMLASITGADWSMKYYPHIPPSEKSLTRESEEIEVITQNVYISYNTKLVRLDIVYNEKRGLCIYCHWATISEFYDDSYIFTAGEILDTRYHFKFGSLSAPLPKLIWRLYKENRFFYSKNDVGAFVESYISYCNHLT